MNNNNLTLQVVIGTMIEYGFEVEDINESITKDYTYLVDTVPVEYHSLRRYIKSMVDSNVYQYTQDTLIIRG